MINLPTPAPILRRFIALIYESLLIGASTFLAALIIGIIQTSLQYYAPKLLIKLHLILTFFYGFIIITTWWLYFKFNWQRKHQTLAMRVWQIGLNTNNPKHLLTLKRLRLRFMWACIFIIFIPISNYTLLRSFLQPNLSMLIALTWWLLPWGFAFFHPRRQFLYDYLAGTELQDWRHTQSS